MLKPVVMKKLSAVILEEKKEPVLRALKEEGLLQFIDASESHVYRDLKLASATSSWIHVEASELLSRINNILDAFKHLKKDRGFLRRLLPEEVEKTPVKELPPKVFFQEMRKKVKPIEEEVKGITSKLEELKKEKEELEAARQGVALVQKLGIAPRDLRSYRSIKVLAGVLPKKELEGFRKDLEETVKDYVMEAEEADKKMVILIAYLKEHDADVGKILRIRRFEELQLPFRYRTYSLEEALAKIEEDSRRIGNEELKLLEKLGEIEKTEKLNLLRMRELLQIEKYLDETNQLFGRTVKTYLLKAWVPHNHVEKAVDIIRHNSQGYCSIIVEDPAEDEEPPTLLTNPSFATPIELLTTTYGTPPYRKIDPTLMMTISFPLMFGLMFGDIGQGLVLVLIGFFLGFYLKLEEVYRKFGRIIFYCGIAAVAGGFLYGSFFGLEGESLKHYLGFELHPLWLSPLHDVSTLITFALVIGLVQLSLGCFLNIANHIRHNPLEAIFSPWGVVGLWLFWGGAFLLWSRGVNQMVEIVLGLFSPSTILASLKILTPFLILPLIIITVGVKYAEAASLGWGIYTSYEAVTRYLFNGISYIRVIALALVHAALSSVMVMLMFQFPPLAIPIFIGGNLVILVMEAVISFIQTLRLHYYEWFSKFYEGKGIGFKAFKVMRRYTFLAPLEAPGSGTSASQQR